LDRIEEENVSENIPYREAIGSLMYLMIGTRPDLAFCVAKLAQYCESPKQKHWTAVKRVLRYVSGTKHFSLTYEAGLAYGYCDSDWAGDVKDRKSTSGYIFMMCGGPVSWSSRKQTVVATSSCEAEYIALSYCCKEAIWLRRLISFLPPLHASNIPKPAMLIFSDSQSAIKLSGNGSINRRNKHIDITYHFVRDVVTRKDVFLEYKPDKDMVADMLTKPLARIKLQHLTGICGLTIMGEH